MPKKSSALEYEAYVDKEPTVVQSSFAEWLEDKTGYEVDAKSVQLATAPSTIFG